MSSDMIMEASLAQESSELPRSTLVQEHDIACIRLACEATERKRSDENANSLTELSAPQFELIDDEVGQKLEVASQVINFENEGLPPNDAAERCLETEQATSTLNGDLLPGSLKDETSTEKQMVGAEKVPNRQTEDGVVESDLKDANVKCLDAGMNTNLDKLEQSPVNVSENCDLTQLEPPSANADNTPCQSGSTDGSISKKSTKRKSSLGSFPTSTRVLRSRLQDKSNVPKPTETGITQVNCLNPERSGLPAEELTRKIDFEQQRTVAEDERISTPDQLGVTNEEVTLSKSFDNPQQLHNNNVTQLEEVANFPVKSGGQGRKSDKISAKGKNPFTISAENARILRSRSQEKSKAPEPSHNAGVHTGTNGEQRRGRKKKKHQNKHPVDEYSRIRKHLKYLLHRMAFEQSFIDAYSGEGWKGQSAEKIKPEKELERAKSEILSCKMRIRDLFKRIDSSIAVGKFSETLYDSDGLIDSEDIYCAKCESKDLLDDNDIILCDGVCERGFHQFCLDPPLLKEKIPSDEEGWLCPGCDCKVDCIGLLNDAQETNLSIFKTWEKVFPEVAAAAAGNKLDENFGLPSDDSDDNDYDPDCSDVDDKAQEDESTSDESDLYCASEESDPVKKLQLSSDDSEDDDFDPDAQDLDEQVEQESSSSDFTSDPEDLSVALDDSHKEEHIPASSDHTGNCKINSETPKGGLKKKQSLCEELLSASKSGPDVLESAPVSERRHVERLDYKKLYDDEYGNDCTDSSDDEWFDAVDAPRKKMKNNTNEVASGSCDPTTQVRKETDDSGVKLGKEAGKQKPKKTGRKKVDAEGAHTSPAEGAHTSTAEGSSEPSSTRKQFKRLGEDVTQGLLQSFKEGQYPDKTKKETLAKELGITTNQVSKWFENARWSFRHTSRMKASLEKCSPTKETPTKSGLQDVAQNAGASVGEQSNTNAGASMNESLTGESSKQRSSTRKRKGQGGQQEHDFSSEKAEEPSGPADLPKAQDVRTSGRRKARKTAP